VALDGGMPVERFDAGALKQVLIKARQIYQLFTDQY